MRDDYEGFKALPGHLSIGAEECGNGEEYEGI